LLFCLSTQEGSVLFFDVYVQYEENMQSWLIARKAAGQQGRLKKSRRRGLSRTFYESAYQKLAP
jgi:hypothetical protein